MPFAESAILLGFHTVRMNFLILRHVVISLFTFCTCQCNSRTHNFHLHIKMSFFSDLCFILGIKKRPSFFHTLIHYNITFYIRQYFFLCGTGISASLLSEIPKHKQSQKNTIPAKHLKIVPLNKGQKKSDNQHRRNKRRSHTENQNHQLRRSKRKAKRE